MRGGAVPMVRIDAELKEKCPRVALACVTAEVETGATSGALNHELRVCEESILKLAEPRAVLESAAILATRTAYKALGKDPARYRGEGTAASQQCGGRDQPGECGEPIAGGAL